MNFILKYRTFIKIIFLLVLFSGFYIFKGINNSLNQTLKNSLYFISGETIPDSNIVIIHISKEDIQNLGNWPLKRSYYALLINRLTSLDAAVIGLEVFLSDKITSQSIYNDLLNDEINKSGKVVLSSVLSAFDGRTAEIQNASPKKKFKDLPSGHLNYFDKYGIFIPLSFESPERHETAFSAALLRNFNFDDYPSLIKVNIFSPWQKFRNYSLIEFFNLFETNNPELNSLKGKTVIVGVSDSRVAQTINTAFDDDLPGAALHAFALDNLIHKRYLRIDYTAFSSFLIILIFTAIVTLKFRINPAVMYSTMFMAFLIISFILFIFYYIEINYSLFAIPFILMVLFDAGLFLLEKKIYVDGIINETEILKLTLDKKESQLLRLQNELNISGENAHQQLVDKISSLKKEIDELKLHQQDESPSVVQLEDDEICNFHGIVYKSKKMNSVIDFISKAAPVDASVIVLGESGTGKELAARAIHKLSKRSNGNFIAVNCAALSDTLLESELFGHVKGAFTNAISDKMGRFEAADKGTIFLDEIGETSENFQVKLLRVLQQGEFEKVGSSKTQRTDIRVIAATNKNLENLVKEKKFREDLYYRLNVIKIELPPLRDRKEDIPVLASYFLRENEEKIDISNAVSEQLSNYDWKGNVRELESVIKRASIFAKSAGRTIIKLNDLPEEIVKLDIVSIDLLILESLREKKFSHSSLTETAEELGNLSRTAVSENFRGIALKVFFDSGFDVTESVKRIADYEDEKVLEKVKTKLLTFLNNIEKDLKVHKGKSFHEVRTILNSKYKNLPQKFHFYLDEIIKFYMDK